MPFFSRNKLPLDPLPVASQQPLEVVCTWSAHAPQPGSSPSPFPRSSHTLTATGNAAGELFLFGGLVYGRANSDLYLYSTRDFSTTLLKTSGEVPTPRLAHGAALIGTTFLICGGRTGAGVTVLNHDLLYFLNLGTSDPFAQVRHRLTMTLHSRNASVVPRCGQWSRAGRPFQPYHKGGRFQALRLWWSVWWEKCQ